jgi:GTPase SAR1 family protein
MSAGELVPFDNETGPESGLAKAADDLIGRALDLMAKSKGLDLVWSGNPDGTDGSVRAVRNDLEAVRNEELRMAVVAPMKAGKSTFVNAMVGYEFLPARGSAMTTLPTRIVLDRLATPAELSDPEGLRPEFSLADADARQLERLSDAVARQLPPRAAEVTRKLPHLEGLVNRILEGGLTRVERSVTGRRAVQQALMDLNDMLRLAEILGLSRFARLSDIPVVRTPYWSPNAVATQGPGRLVIIDTPGPDEANLAETLAPVVRQQLLQSHIVFVVLDYTHMNNQADEKVRKLMGPTLDVIGKDKLYAIVNKIDQRDSELETELTDKQLVRAVGAVLDLPEDLARERVYRISAEYALRSAVVLGEIAGGRLGDIRGSESVRRLLRLTEGRNYKRAQEEYAADGGTERLADLARKSWDEEGLLDEFLNSAVADLRALALPEVITTALGKTIKEVGDLVDAVRARRDLIGRESGELANAAREITSDMKRVAGFRSTMASADEVAKRTVAAVRKILDRARDRGDDILTAMVKNLKGETQRFDTDSAARMFIQATTAGPGTNIDILLASAIQAAEAEIGRAAREYLAAEGRKVQPVIDRAAASLKDAFDIRFTVPDFTLTMSDADISISPERHTESWTTSETRTSYERRWYTLGMWRHKVTETVHVPHSSSYYTVSTKALAEQLRASLHARVGEIRAELSGQVRQDLEARMSEYFDEVERFLLRYKEFLEQSARDNQLVGKAKQELCARLDAYHADAARLQTELHEHHEVAAEQLQELQQRQRQRNAE